MAATEQELKIVAQLEDFRARVLRADELRRLGELEEADKVEPTEEELFEAIKAYREAISQRSGSRTKRAESKTKVNEIRQMEDLNDLFGKKKET